jgi:hypothetical protein
MTAPVITGGSVTGVTFTGNTFSNPVVTGVSTFAAGTVSAPAITTTGDTNTGIFFPAADTIAFAEGGAEAMRITSDGELLVGGTVGLHQTSGGVSIQRTNATPVCYLYRNDTSIVTNDALGSLGFYGNDTTSNTPTQLAFINAVASGTHAAGDNPTDLTFGTTADNTATATERMRITSAGQVCVGTTTAFAPLTVEGGASFRRGTSASALAANNTTSSAGAGYAIDCDRELNDGGLISFRSTGTIEGSISVSGTTVSYTGGHLSRYAQTTTAKDDTLLKGTVLSNLDEMNEYVSQTTYWAEENELPEGVNVGDVKSESAAVENEQLNKVKVSDVEGDANVAGVFVNWYFDEQHQVDEINMAMTGDMIIRVAQGVEVQKGDLLMSAGDGTAKPQGDDIVRSKTIAKVTSNHVTCTYADGSYCVPCVLMAC